MSRGWRGLWADALATDNGRRQWSPSGPLARRIRVQIEVLLLLPFSRFQTELRQFILWFGLIQFYKSNNGYVPVW